MAVNFAPSERFKETNLMLGVHGQDVEFAAKTLLASNTHSRTNPRQPARKLVEDAINRHMSKKLYAKLMKAEKAEQDEIRELVDQIS
jgi:hypothetical protein